MGDCAHRSVEKPAAADDNRMAASAIFISWPVRSIGRKVRSLRQRIISVC